MPVAAPPHRTMQSRQHRGAMSHAAGLSAEDQVIRFYQLQGHKLLEQRWRGAGAEIDLIFCKDASIICVEVKSSRTHDRAVQNLSRRQLLRLHTAAEEFLGHQPAGSLTPMRLDVALVDAQGRIEILENALMDL